ncbi:MAG TPA: SRPBCC family protein, partial [bacterium]|nr:SRPBCC family protein [bacterium]
MPEYVLRSQMPVSAQELYAWHARPGALERLLPPHGHVSLPRHAGPALREGAQVELRIQIGPLARRWLLRRLQVREGSSFQERQTEGPFADWSHVHRFVPESAQTCWMEDAVQYALPWGWAGREPAERLVRRVLECEFRFRHRRLLQDLQRHAQYRQARPWRIAVSGAGGLVGRALCAYLSSAGHTVLRLARPGAAAGSLAVSGEIPWEPGEAL